MDRLQVQASIRSRLTFWNIFWSWIAVTALFSVLNTALIHDQWLLSSLVRSGMGITFLIYPVYPPAFELPARRKKAWSPAKCRAVIRAVAVAEIALSFLLRIQY